MITAGVDVGAQTVKVVILKDDKLASYSILKSGFELQQSCQRGLEQALAKIDLTPADVQRAVATGVGRKEAGFANDDISVIAADARGAVWLYPKVRTIIDVGYEEAWGIRCDSNGKVIDYGKNEKCAAGVGAFIETMARALEINVEEMGELSLQSNRDLALNFTCAIFAESEVISLIHAKTAKPDIVRAIHESIAIRVSSMMRRISAGIEPDVLFIGGLAKNVGVVERVKHHLGSNIILPEEPQIVTALGAALAARQ